MMIRVATIGYAREPDFELHAPNVPTTEERIAWALLHRPVFQNACKEEGIDRKVPQRIIDVLLKKQKARQRKEEAEGVKREAKL